MRFLKISQDRYINLDQVTYVYEKKDKVYVLFQVDPNASGILGPSTICELKGDEAQRFLQWMEANSEKV